MDIKIGKFTLETLTTGMYDSPKDIYREYIQNAVDSIDNAIAEGILKPGKDCIEIKIDRLNTKTQVKSIRREKNYTTQTLIKRKLK